MTPDQHQRGQLVARLAGGDQEGAAGGEQRQREDEAGGGHASDLLAGGLLARNRHAARRQLRGTLIDPLEVVQKRLDRLHAGVVAIPCRNLARERLCDAGRLCDRLPSGGGNRPKAGDKGLQDGAHEPIVSRFREIVKPFTGSDLLDTSHKGERTMVKADLWKVPTNDEELYTMTSPPARDVLAENLKALMRANPQYGTLLALEQATATRGGGKKIGKTTLGNILAKTTPINLDYVEILAKVFGLAPWQMLVPQLQPTNPQILRSTGAEEDALYKKLEELRTLVEQIDEVKGSGERTFPERSDDAGWPGTERRLFKRDVK